MTCRQNHTSFVFFGFHARFHGNVLCACVGAHATGGVSRPEAALGAKGRRSKTSQLITSLSGGVRVGKIPEKVKVCFAHALH